MMTRPLGYICIRKWERAQISHLASFSCIYCGYVNTACGDFSCTLCGLLFGVWEFILPRHRWLMVQWTVQYKKKKKYQSRPFHSGCLASILIQLNSCSFECVSQAPVAALHDWWPSHNTSSRAQEVSGGNPPDQHERNLCVLRPIFHHSKENPRVGTAESWTAVTPSSIKRIIICLNLV